MEGRFSVTERTALTFHADLSGTSFTCTCMTQELGKVSPVFFVRGVPSLLRQTPVCTRNVVKEDIKHVPSLQQEQGMHKVRSSMLCVAHRTVSRCCSPPQSSSHTRARYASPRNVREWMAVWFAGQAWLLSAYCLAECLLCESCVLLCCDSDAREPLQNTAGQFRGV